VAVSIKSITSATNATTAATFTCTTSESPSVTSVGDLVVVLHSNDFYALTNMSTPSATGSPTMNSIGSVDGGANLGHVKAWWYVANTAGAQTVTATETGTHDEEKDLVVIVLSGADTVSPIDGTPASSAGAATTPHVVPSITTATTNTMQVAIDVTGGGVNSTSYTPAAGLTNQQYFTVASAFAGEVMTGSLASAGASPTVNVTPAGSVNFHILTFAIKQAAAAATGEGRATWAVHPAPGAVHRADAHPVADARRSEFVAAHRGQPHGHRCRRGYGHHHGCSPARRHRGRAAPSRSRPPPACLTPVQVRTGSGSPQLPTGRHCRWR
jgi:hypothetical protein